MSTRIRGYRWFAKNILNSLIFVVVFVQTGAAQTPATVEIIHPVVVAGEKIQGVVVLDRAPEFEGGIITVQISRPPAPDLIGPSMSPQPITVACEGPENSPDHNSSVIGYGFFVSSAIAVHKNVTRYAFECKTDKYSPDATWKIDHIVFHSWDLDDISDPRANRTDVPLSFTPVTVEVKATPPPKSLPRDGIPHSAKVEINGTQIQLLRAEARVLQSRVEEFKTAIGQLQTANGVLEQKLLRMIVADTLDRLQQTEKGFFKRGSKGVQDEASRIFFEDLRANYQQVEQALKEKRAIIGQPLPHVQSASLDQHISAGFSPLTQVVLRVMERNILAYNIFADDRSGYFDLRVESDPVGATISYKRWTAADDQYKQSRQPTACTIENLYLARWTIRFEAKGRKTYVAEFDAVTEKDRIVSVKLERSER